MVKNFITTRGQPMGKIIRVSFICSAIILSLSSCSSLGTLLSTGITLNHYSGGPIYNLKTMSKEDSFAFPAPEKKDYAQSIYNLDQSLFPLARKNTKNYFHAIALERPTDPLTLKVIPGLVIGQNPFEDNSSYWGLEKYKEADIFNHLSVALELKLTF